MRRQFHFLTNLLRMGKKKFLKKNIFVLIFNVQNIEILDGNGSRAEVSRNSGEAFSKTHERASALFTFLLKSVHFPMTVTISPLYLFVPLYPRIAVCIIGAVFVK